MLVLVFITSVVKPLPMKIPSASVIKLKTLLLARNYTYICVSFPSLTDNACMPVPCHTIMHFYIRYIRMLKRKQLGKQM